MNVAEVIEMGDGQREGDKSCVVPYITIVTSLTSLIVKHEGMFKPQWVNYFRCIRRRFSETSTHGWD